MKIPITVARTGQKYLQSGTCHAEVSPDNSARRYRHLVLTIAIIVGSLVAFQGPSSRGKTPELSAASPVASLPPEQVANPEQLPPAADVGLPTTLHLGTQTCASANCHGKAISEGISQSEYTVWMQQDRHSQAYAVLLNSKSRRMAEKLGKEKLQGESAATSKRCLACHSVPEEQVLDKQQYAVLKQNGVGCECCHGGAELWLSTHTRANDWLIVHGDEANRKSRGADSAEQQRIKLQTKRSHGFQNTWDLQSRAAICAKCHVGSENGDMDHDLIAAGHPPLFFEFSKYLAKMPAHWDRKQDETRNGNDAHAWLVGQVVAAKAATEQLKRRAGHPGQSVWPEFSEYDCFTCHHDLQGDSWRQKLPISSRRPGIFRWGTWYFPILASNPWSSVLGQNGRLTSLTVLQNEMSKPRPDSATVVSLAGKLIAELEQQMPLRDKLKEEDLRNILKAIQSDPELLAAQTWAAAAQHYLAADAENRAFGKPIVTSRFYKVATDPSLSQRREKLMFTPQNKSRYDSPKQFVAPPK